MTRTFLLFFATLGVLVFTLAACDRREPPKTNAELGLNPQQAAGRALYDTYCLRCHEAYSSHAENGPSLKGVYKKPYFPSGTPANDERMADVILHGRSKMPAFGDRMNDQQVQDMIAYIHTL